MKVKLRPDQITTGSWGAERSYDRVTGLTPASLHDPLQSPDHIRLMLLYPPGWPHHETKRVTHHLDTNLQCKVFQAHLDDLSTNGRPNFATLSYCWGSTEKRRSMICNETRVRTTENLFQALKWICLPTRPRLIWVDYLSISQTDLMEKSAQVARMGRIFSEAHVISYIGGTRNIGLAGTFLAMVRRMSAISDFLGADMINGSSTDDLINRPPIIYNQNRPLNMPEWQKVPWDVIVDLMNRKYFSRLWMLQEINQATSQTCQWGLHSCTMKQLNRACQLVLAGKQKTIAPSPFKSDHSTFLAKAYQNLQMMCRKSFLFNAEMPIFDADFAVVAGAMQFACSDPQDHIYGVTSLFEGPETYPVDYSLDVAEVLAGFTFHMLSTRKPERPVPLFLFSHAHYSTFRDPDSYARKMGSKWSSRSLPSWCPDFGLRRPATHWFANNFYEIERTDGPNSQLPACICPFSFRILCVRGVRCATVAACSRKSQSVESNEPFDSESGRLAMRLLSYKPFTNVGIELLDALREERRRIWREAYPLHPFHTTNVRDQYWSILESFAPYFFKIYIPCLYAQWKTTESSHSNFTTDQIDACVVEMKTRVMQYDGTIRRCFFTTPSGPLGSRIGCCSDAVRPSDETFVVYGVENPIAIRRVGNQEYYKYVGNCYFNGLMQGEAPELGLPVEHILLV